MMGVSLTIMGIRERAADLARRQEGGAVGSILAALPMPHCHDLLERQARPLGIEVGCLPSMGDDEPTFCRDGYDKPLTFVTTDELLNALRKRRDQQPFVPALLAYLEAYQAEYGDCWDVWVLYWD